MANWLNTIDIVTEYNAAVEDTNNIPELAAAIANKLNALEPFRDPRIEEQRNFLIGDFEYLAEKCCDDADEFDFSFETLYEWADKSTCGGKVCWIKTF